MFIYFLYRHNGALAAFRSERDALLCKKSGEQRISSANFAAHALEEAPPGLRAALELGDRLLARVEEPG